MRHPRGGEHERVELVVVKLSEHIAEAGRVALVAERQRAWNPDGRARTGSQHQRVVRQPAA
jgi:hypothetical protein